MRFPKPFFRASKDAWYVRLGKRQISLGKDCDEAFERYRVLLLQERGENPEPAFRRLTVALRLPQQLRSARRSLVEQARLARHAAAFRSAPAGQSPEATGAESAARVTADPKLVAASAIINHRKYIQ